jgi:hypothetical protein
VWFQKSQRPRDPAEDKFHEGDDLEHAFYYICKRFPGRFEVLRLIGTAGVGSGSSLYARKVSHRRERGNPHRSASQMCCVRNWIPAFAGMTSMCRNPHGLEVAHGGKSRLSYGGQIPGGGDDELFSCWKV